MLNVHQPSNIERLCKCVRTPLEFLKLLLNERVGWQHTVTVSGMNARFLNVLHDTPDEGHSAVRNCIDIHFNRIFQIFVNQYRMFRRSGNCGVHIFF